MGLPGGGELLLAQQEDAHFRQIETGGEGRASEGKRTEGWLTAESGAGGLGLAMRHMAEQHPTALRVSGSVGMSPMGLSLLFFGVPYLLEALAEAGMEEPGG